MPGSPREPRFPAWTVKWRTAAFSRRVKALQATFWKLDRSASHLGSRLSFIDEHLRVQDLSFTPEFLDAMSDTAVFLDALILYFRITADIVAKLIPFLYPDPPQMPTRSFRDQVTWYRKSPDFDHDYLDILDTSLEWFHTLAGKNPKGLRDVLVHYLGDYQFGWRDGLPSGPKEFKASLTSELGYASQDLIPDLTAMARGFFLFLDRAFRHFSRLIRAQFDWQFLLPDSAIAEFFDFEEGAMPSVWLYPSINTEPPAA